MRARGAGARSGRGREGADERGAGRSRNGSTGGRATRPRVGTYRDLGSFQLLLSLQDDEALRLFCDSILGPIEASEGHYGGELMRSLEAFIEENGQWERAARRLYCHRHTLRYRIRRVEELTGRNLAARETGSSSGWRCADASSCREVFLAIGGGAEVRSGFQPKSRRTSTGSR